MSKDDTTNSAIESAEELFLNMSPDERRSRVFLEPAFRDAYNEIIDAHRVVQVPHYFWKHWVSILGPVATALYMQLRQYCYYNPQTGEKRDWCWPKQTTLAQEIGVKDKKTIRKALLLLEKYSFIKRQPQYRKGKAGAPQRGTDRYLVFFEIPLITEHAVDLLLRENQDSSYEGKKSPHSDETVENRAYEGKISSHKAGEKIPRRTSTGRSTPNVNNVGISTREGSLQTDPRVRTLTPQERTNREVLALEMGDKLSIMSGQRDLAERKDAGFLRRVAFLMPEQLVNEALTATRDAVENQRAGRKAIPKGAAAYFTGVVKKIAEREGIDLGLKSKS